MNKTDKKAKKAKKNDKTAKKRKLFAIVEAQNINCGSRNPCDDLYPWATLHKSRDAARDALREQMREVVNAAYEGFDDVEGPNIDDILDQIFEEGDEKCCEWFWNGGDRSVRWRIIEVEVN